jgi:hypothetical protein
VVHGHLGLCVGLGCAVGLAALLATLTCQRRRLGPYPGRDAAEA